VPRSDSPEARAGRDVDGHLVLVGMMGTGKTTVGTVLARRLGRSLIDSDAEVEARTGRTVREIFETDGEAAYRPLETDALLDALASPVPAVIAAAGGVVLSATNRQAIEDHAGLVVWLRADPTLIVGRVGHHDHRPLLDYDPAGTVTRLEAEREPLYAEVADRIVDVDNKTPDQIADEILA
jgi:shikimate kinase